MDCTQNDFALGKMRYDRNSPQAALKFIGNRSRAKSALRIDMHVRRMYSGRPSSSVRFSDVTAMRKWRPPRWSTALGPSAAGGLDPEDLSRS